uniref:Protein FAM102A n=1 Tax=Anthurium amnicola TaxID=1678845 RepID=A0A1D1ZGL6_9ARAE
MVARMMRWRPWPPLLSKKFLVRVVLLRLECPPVDDAAPAPAPGGNRMLTAEVRWKGPKTALPSLRRPSIRRNCTREVHDALPSSSSVEWNEEFETECSLSAHKDNAYHPWEIALSVFHSNEGHRNKSALGTGTFNLAEFASSAEGKEIEIKVPLTTPGVSYDPPPSLYLSLSLLELRTAQDSSDTVQRSTVPMPLSPASADTPPTEKDELSALKAGLRKVKIFTELVSTRKPRKTSREDEGSEERCSARSEDAEHNYPFDTDSLDDDIDEADPEDGKEDSSIRKSFSYGTLAAANHLGGSFYSEVKTNGEFDDWIYYSHRKSDVGSSHASDMPSSSELYSLQTSKRSILPWRKRKLSFRSPKTKGEPLLKKAYAEEGGDDIDYDRRQLSSSDESFGWHKVDDDVVANKTPVSEFGDDNFTVGSWEKKEVVSRDGRMKICTQVFFASIDQRSERAAGESACTALVAVIANWFQNNKDTMPIKSQFDSLIRDGSLEWRNLCENETYREHFPDKHFDLETILQAKIQPLSVVPRKSFIGFFHPEGTDGDNSRFDFLNGSMSFDSIWEEISRVGSEHPSDGSPHIYIVSWNDHFFVLKVESEAYYIIDTLGERLHEGCHQAYILKFDENTTICKMGRDEKPASGETGETGSQLIQQTIVKGDGPVERQEQSNSGTETEEIICRGKESCKEYIKSFLAAIPIRELQADIKKGLMASTPIHHRLQIELHYTELLKSTVAALPPPVESVIKFPQPTLEPATSFTLTSPCVESGAAAV